MEISRRGLFKLILPGIGCGIVVPQDGGADLILLPNPDGWMEPWLAARRIPIVTSRDPVEQTFIRAIRMNRPVEFAYFGGSDSGMERRVHPAMLYRVEGFSGVYVTGFCETRREIRTFRLDRICLAQELET